MNKINILNGAGTTSIALSILYSPFQWLCRSEFISFIALHVVVHTFLCHLLVVFFHSSQVLSRLSELALFHSLSDIPVHEGPFGVHQVNFVVHPAHHLGDGRGVTDHEDRPLDFGQVSSRNHGGRLVVDPDFESGRTPIHEPDGPLGLHRPDGGIHVFGHHVPSIHHAARHILSVSRVTFHHLVRRLEHRVRDLRHRQLLMVRDLRRDHRGKGTERAVYSSWCRSASRCPGSGGKCRAA